MEVLSVCKCSLLTRTNLMKALTCRTLAADRYKGSRVFYFCLAIAMNVLIILFAHLTLSAYLLCCVHRTNAESGVCYSSVTRYRTGYRSSQSGYDSYSCGFLWLSRCRRATYRRESYRMSYIVTERRCCSGYTECTINSSRCCQINECHTRQTNDCDQICRDTDTSYTCSCRSGYRLASDGRTCEDIDECAEGTNQCDQICINTIGSYSCSCESDYCLASDGLICDYNTFTMKPSNSRVILGENATFHCQFPGADAIEWKVNNVSLSEQTDVYISNQIKQNNISGDVHILTITALKLYNGTTVKCLANHCQQEVESPTVNLLIQGRLDAVTDLHITESPGQILIIWQPPFTLNLTNRIYSIMYCVDITEDSTDKHYVSACNITETQYIFRIDIYPKIEIPLTVIVTPENGLGKGKEHNVSANNIIYSSELSTWQKLGVAASVASLITAFVTVPCLVTSIYWIIKKVRKLKLQEQDSNNLENDRVGIPALQMEERYQSSRRSTDTQSMSTDSGGLDQYNSSTRLSH